LSCGPKNQCVGRPARTLIGRGSGRDWSSSSYSARAVPVLTSQRTSRFPARCPPKSGRQISGGTVPDAGEWWAGRCGIGSREPSKTPAEPGALRPIRFVTKGKVRLWTIEAPTAPNSRTSRKIQSGPSPILRANPPALLLSSSAGGAHGRRATPPSAVSASRPRRPGRVAHGLPAGAPPPIPGAAVSAPSGPVQLPVFGPALARAVARER